MSHLACKVLLSWERGDYGSSTDGGGRTEVGGGATDRGRWRSGRLTEDGGARTVEREGAAAAVLLEE